ncbi:hypothetical protein DWB68_13080 [Galactobacter valiniphilus]|uniref:Uncharacterized protein n=1 Tax=Galactobacter valiniphilus TaxID=2676122 RepID=A0A399JA21_9MICC|nr:hypothetical protein [Galactobacter valiniphilus]RII41357.1 hypothetical protein DWB68_13080 [Galactobacter valiniphilus]
MDRLPATGLPGSALFALFAIAAVALTLGVLLVRRSKAAALGAALALALTLGAGGAVLSAPTTQASAVAESCSADSQDPDSEPEVGGVSKSSDPAAPSTSAEATEGSDPATSGQPSTDEPDGSASPTPSESDGGGEEPEQCTPSETLIDGTLPSETTLNRAIFFSNTSESLPTYDEDGNQLTPGAPAVVHADFQIGGEGGQEVIDAIEVTAGWSNGKAAIPTTMANTRMVAADGAALSLPAGTTWTVVAKRAMTGDPFVMLRVEITNPDWTIPYGDGNYGTQSCAMPASCPRPLPRRRSSTSPSRSPCTTTARRASSTASWPCRWLAPTSRSSAPRPAR